MLTNFSLKDRVTIRVLPLIALTMTAVFEAQSQQLPRCFGEAYKLTMQHHVPYLDVSLSNVHGLFALDWDADWSSFDMSKLTGITMTPSQSRPNMFSFAQGLRPLDGDTADLVNESRDIQGVTQQGVVGTDFLSEQIYTVDYASGSLYKSTQVGFCTPPFLLSQGFHAVSGLGYLSVDPSSTQQVLKHPNVAIAPARLNSIPFDVWLDTANDDDLHANSITINQALFQLLDQSKVLAPQIIPNPLVNSTCAKDVNGKPVYEPLKFYKLKNDVIFTIVSESGQDISIPPNPTIVLKMTPEAALKCGGIGASDRPMAQLGASILASYAVIVFDPFASRYWIKPR